MGEDQDTSPSKLSKEELIQSMDRVDREIAKVEQQILKLKKKQVGPLKTFYHEIPFLFPPTARPDFVSGIPFGLFEVFKYCINEKGMEVPTCKVLLSH